MPINRRSSHDLNPAERPLRTFFQKMGELDKKMEQARIESVKEIAKHRLSKIATPENFVRDFDGKQREKILKDQFLNRVSAAELKPFLMADREYLVTHFRNRDLCADEVSNDQKSVDEIPNEFYFDFEEIEKTMRFPIEFIKNEEVEAVLSEINPEILKELRTFDFYQCVQITDLSALSKFQFDHLHEINCSGMSSLTSLNGLPNKCRYRELNLKDCTDLKSLAALENVSIKKLNLNHCTDISDLTPLLHVKDLEVVNLTRCQKARPTPVNIEVLETLKARKVQIHGEMHTLLPWMKYKHLFEETKKMSLSDQIRG